LSAYGADIDCGDLTKRLSTVDHGNPREGVDGPDSARHRADPEYRPLSGGRRWALTGQSRALDAEVPSARRRSGAGDRSVHERRNGASAGDRAGAFSAMVPLAVVWSSDWHESRRVAGPVVGRRRLAWPIFAGSTESRSGQPDNAQESSGSACRHVTPA